MVENQAASKMMLDLYKSKFEDLSKHMFNLIVKEASTSGIPDFGDAEFEDDKVESFTGNLTITRVVITDVFG